MSSADFTIYTTSIATLTYYNLISFGESSAFPHFAAAIPFHYNLAFSFHQVPMTAGWTEAAWHERFARHVFTWPAAWTEHQPMTGSHPSKYQLGLALLNFGDLTGAGYNSVICYHTSSSTQCTSHWRSHYRESTEWHCVCASLCKEATIHQVTTMLATSKNVLFPGHNHLLTTGTDDLSLWLSPSLVLGR